MHVCERAHRWDTFPGQYELVSSVRTHADGTVEDCHGIPPVGRTYYDNDGHMWVLLAPAGRPPLPPPATATARDYLRLLRNVVAYFGTYEVDPSIRTVIHRVEAAIDPAWVGRLLCRQYEFSGNRLTLTFTEADYTMHTTYERLRGSRVDIDTQVAS
jgi:hypothetical protein